MAELNRLEYNFPKDSRTAFEDMCTHLFCVHLGLREAVSRRKNQWGIESDPVEVDGRTYAFQAKYYDAGAAMSDHKDDLVKSVEAAGKAGATDLIIFVNKDRTQNSKTHDKPAYEKEVEREAQKQGVEVHWWDESRIGTTLNMPDYCHIRRIYVDSEREAGLSAFYSDIYKGFAERAEDELFGGMALRDSYIEPSIGFQDKYGRETVQSVREFLKSWVVGDETIAVICGEPGHGKSALCKRAMCDFYKCDPQGIWLAGVVKNVFRFSLNPANTTALADGQLKLYDLLTWGGDRTAQEHRVRLEDCEGALVFLDGFDELVEWRPGLDLGRFIRDYVVQFQKDTESHVIITSRSVVVDHGGEGRRSEIVVDRRRRDPMHIPILRLQPVTREWQKKWIQRYADHCHDSWPEGSDELKELDGYAERFEQLRQSDKMERILGIPIIFRMVVVARYVPSGEASITRMYDDLFDVTWDRHRHHEGDLPADVDPREEARAKLARHALRIFCDNNDTAPVDSVSESPWLFSFYTTHEGGRRVGFLHRSFYQYFLAFEIMSWLRDFAERADAGRLRERLACLACRPLDMTTFGYICDLHAADKDASRLDASFDAVYAILKETDGFLPSLPDGIGAEALKEVTPLERANNVFWNTVSICSICGHPVSCDKVNVHALRTYDMSGSLLIGAQLEGANLTQACFRAADLLGAHLQRADFTGAVLLGAGLWKAGLQRACLWDTDLWGADLREADLSYSNLTGADIRDSNLQRSDFLGANLMGARVHGKQLVGANFTDAKLDVTTRRELEQSLSEQSSLQEDLEA